MAVSSSDIGFFSIVLFKISALLLVLLLGLQLIRSMLPFPFDIMTLFSWEQFIFVYGILIITVLAFVEGITLMKRDSFNFGVLVLFIVGGIGVYFTVTVFIFGYSFNDSTTNLYIGYFLLTGVVLILVNAREQFAQLLTKKK